MDNQDKQNSIFNNISLHITIAIIITFVVIVTTVSNHNKEIAKQKNEKIKQEMDLAYDCYINKKEGCLNTHVNTIVKLKNESNDLIKNELKYRFDEERSKIVAKMAEANKIVVSNNQENTFFNDSFLSLKSQYLKTYFNNNEDELYEALDKHNGYRYYAKKEKPRPKSGIVESTIIKGTNGDNIYILVHSHDLLVEFIDVKTNNKMSIFIRKNEWTSVPLPIGEYKMVYKGGDIWCGAQDSFKRIYMDMEGESSHNIIINDKTILYFGQKATYFNDEYIFLSLGNYISLLEEDEWIVAVRAINRYREQEEKKQYEKEQKEIEKMNNPNYDLKLINTGFKK